MDRSSWMSDAGYNSGNLAELRSSGGRERQTQLKVISQTLRRVEDPPVAVSDMVGGAVFIASCIAPIMLGKAFALGVFALLVSLLSASLFGWIAWHLIRIHAPKPVNHLDQLDAQLAAYKPLNPAALKALQVELTAEGAFRTDMIRKWLDAEQKNLDVLLGYGLPTQNRFLSRDID